MFHNCICGVIAKSVHVSAKISKNRYLLNSNWYIKEHVSIDWVLRTATLWRNWVTSLFSSQELAATGFHESEVKVLTVKIRDWLHSQVIIITLSRKRLTPNTRIQTLDSGRFRWHNTFEKLGYSVIVWETKNSTGRLPVWFHAKRIISTCKSNEWGKKHNISLSEVQMEYTSILVMLRVASRLWVLTGEQQQCVGGNISSSSVLYRGEPWQ